jgi:phosphoglycolate phosphatase-like HAD superfamily hydrolase
MTPNSIALDTAIRNARHLLFTFDGPIRRAHAGDPADSAAPIAPYVHETMMACRESGRSAVVIRAKQYTDTSEYLEAHDLSTHITFITGSVPDAITVLEATPTACLLITSSPADIKIAQAAGVPSIGYARTPDDAARLADAGATAFAYSMAEITLSLRAHRLGL